MRTGKLLKFDADRSRFIIFSDQHKGDGDLADDFATNKDNYHAALDYYLTNGFTYINLGDCEELWENGPEPVLARYAIEMKQEAAFKADNRYYRIFGNHDILWFDKTAVTKFLSPIFGIDTQVLEGLVLRTTVSEKEVDIFLAHGHQGDRVSDSNAFSKWFVGRIWVPIQRWLELNVNTPAKDFHLTDKHNVMMYEWTKQFENVILITGHTHKPVFESLTHIQRISKELEEAIENNNDAEIERLNAEIQKRIIEYKRNAGTQDNTQVRPSYYNSGCCCFNDGDITGIEIADGHMRLVKWYKKDGISQREVKEESHFSHIAASL